MANNKQYTHGYSHTPLMAAAIYQHGAIIEILLQCNAMQILLLLVKKFVLTFFYKDGKLLKEGINGETNVYDWGQTFHIGKKARPLVYGKCFVTCYTSPISHLSPLVLLLLLIY